MCFCFIFVDTPLPCLPRPAVQAVLAFIREGAGLPSSSTASGDGSVFSGDDAASDSGTKAPREGELALDEESLALLEERGIEALVVAFVEGGDTDAIPGWREATKSLQGQVRWLLLVFYYCR